jgi:integrase
MITNTAIDAMQPGAEIKDDQVPGLSVRRNPGGWSWMLRYRKRGGAVKRPKIGAYPTISLKDARSLARSWLVRLAGGDDPAVPPKSEPLLDDLWARCEREHYNRGTAWDGEAKRIYNVHIKERLGGHRLGAIDYDVVHRLHAGMKALPFQANRALAVLAKMLYLAERWKLRPPGSNPCQYVSRYPEPRRRRYASPAELSAAAAALQAEAIKFPAAVAFIYLLMFSGARPSEIVNATPAMIERTEGGGVLRIEQGKTGQRDVFLPAQAMQVIDRLPKDGIAQRSREGVLGAYTITGLAGPPRDVWDRVRKAAGCPDLRMRDLRRTFATIAMSNGVTPGQIGELLGHRSVQTTKIYAKLMESPAHAAAAAVAGKIDQIIGGGK